MTTIMDVSTIELMSSTYGGAVFTLVVEQQLEDFMATPGAASSLSSEFTVNNASFARMTRILVLKSMPYSVIVFGFFRRSLSVMSEP